MIHGLQENQAEYEKIQEPQIKRNVVPMYVIHGLLTIFHKTCTYYKSVIVINLFDKPVI